MRKKGLPPSVLNLIVAIIGVIVAILLGFLVLAEDGLRPRLILFLVALLLVLTLSLLSLLYQYRRIGLFAVVFLLLIGAIGWVVPYVRAHWLFSPPKPDFLKAVLLDAQREYSGGNFEKTIEILEPVVRDASYGDKQLERLYHLLGLAYLSVPEPQCTDAQDLLPRISQQSLAASLFEKCRMACRLCGGTFR
jgi:hypothetical protein